MAMRYLGPSILAAATLARAVVIDLPIISQNTYTSVEVEIGTPPKTYRLLLDTGSATSWVTSAACENTTACPNLSHYTRVGYEKTSTAKDLNAYSFIGFIDGDGISGHATQDVFTIPGSTTPVTWNQTFISANTSSWRFITADGFLGLGFASIAEKNTSTLVETLMQDDLLDEPRFAIFYGTTDINEDTGANPDGRLTIGGSHENIYVEGSMNYAPLRQESPFQLWRTPLRSIIVNTGKTPGNGTNTSSTTEKNVTLNPTRNGRAVFDTGAGRISLPSEIAGGIYSQLGWSLPGLLQGSASWTCDAFNSTWGITFVLGDGAVSDDVHLEIRGDELLNSVCQPPFDDSGVQGFALLGRQLLGRYYTVYDFGGSNVDIYKPKIGFGRLKKEFDYLHV
ncbi:related to aspartic proteinase, pepstatin-sensitive [Rhynchosporium graminicola]|uniref:Related to aspartic proteinase, pepstatin-sensitive n=1 Tax=Rhynchosporium graminicola TaxID=2792576 RepID=A0A1E1LR51_9HELO|nr:related to aspartic proteinase, pepstatin-sensitive [Rhynchosporium commune]